MAVSAKSAFSPKAAYTIMAKALRESGRDIVLSICEWGNNQPERWAAPVGHLWRTTGDIYDAWEGKKSWKRQAACRRRPPTPAISPWMRLKPPSRSYSSLVERRLHTDLHDLRIDFGQ